MALCLRVQFFLANPVVLRTYDLDLLVSSLLGQIQISRVSAIYLFLKKKISPKLTALSVILQHAVHRYHI